MFRYVSLLFIIFTFSSCKESKLTEKFIVKITPEKPLVVNASTVRQVVTITEEGREIEIVEVPGPWTRIGFGFRNENDKVITIIAVTIDVTGPDGKVRSQSLFRLDEESQPSPIFATIRPENDVNCDGIVDSSEKDLVDPILPDIGPGGVDCPLDNANPSFDGSQAFLENLLSGLEGAEKDTYRSASYLITARFEGWLGGPTDIPEENFLKEFTFTAQTN